MFIQKWDDFYFLKNNDFIFKKFFIRLFKCVILQITMLYVK